MARSEAITIPGAPAPAGPYSHARIHGDHVWVTGQIGRDPRSGKIVEGGFEAEFQQAITNLESVLKAAGSSLDKVVWAQVEYLDEANLDTMNRVYGQRFHNPYPARASFGVAFIWKGAQVMINCWATLS
jgi:2-iminobutanoate/2-iminopropanoate deaminase